MLSPDSISEAITQAVVVIPARLGSTRFAEKVLADQTGRPLVQHVVDRVRLCRHVREVLVATDHERIAAALEPFDTRVMMTRPDHPSGTDRIAEVAVELDDQIIVNVQGDEPEIEPGHIDALIETMATSGAEMATLAVPMPAGMNPNDPTRVKVVSSVDGRALYFSRSAIPFWRDAGPAGPPAPVMLHVGTYAYRRDFLLRLGGLKPTPLETTEKLEQLRVLEHGHSIRVVAVDAAAGGVDTPEQYAAFVERFRTAASAGFP